MRQGLSCPTLHNGCYVELHITAGGSRRCSARYQASLRWQQPIQADGAAPTPSANPRTHSPGPTCRGATAPVRPPVAGLGRPRSPVWYFTHGRRSVPDPAAAARTGLDNGLARTALPLLASRPAPAPTQRSPCLALPSRDRAVHGTRCGAPAPSLLPVRLIARPRRIPPCDGRLAWMGRGAIAICCRRTRRVMGKGGGQSSTVRQS